MAQDFRNDSSHCLFIGNRDLTQVIQTDERELAELGGSFDAIADRMQELVDYANKKGYILGYEENSRLVDPVLADFQRRYGEDFQKNPEAWEEYRQAWAQTLAKHPKTHYDGKVAVLQIMGTRGFQVCPFGCPTTWSEDVEIASRKNGRALTINKGTAHLARAHRLLEKDNQYGISAKEFYESFM